MHDVIVETTAGKLRGRRESGLAVFRGIRYAEAPTGPLRFRNPVPTRPWTGVKNALEFAPICPQVQGTLLPGPPQLQSEDCLALNVWTPDIDSGRRPVMFWIHGGGFVQGSSSAPLYYGETFAAGGVVLVSINYRLHVLGFLDLEGRADGFEGSANSGIMDLVCGLEWVRDNIAAFGGDPGRVTIFGESAGAALVGALMGTPRARGLFHRAINQSGTGHHTRTRAVANRATDLFFEDMGVKVNDVDALQELPIERIVAQTPSYAVGVSSQLRERVFAGEDLLGGMPFRMTTGDDILPIHPIQAVANGDCADIELVVGANDDEFRLVYFAGGEQAAANSGLTPIEVHAERLGTTTADLLELYRRVDSGRSEVDVTIALSSDLWFIMPGHELADLQSRHQPNTFRYSFSWRTPAFGGIVGAVHGLDLPFVFNHLKDMERLVGQDAPESLSKAIQDTWIRFATTGAAGWPAWSATNPRVMRWDVEPAVVDDPETDRTACWKPIFPALS